MEEYLKSTKVPREERVPRSKISPRKLYFRRLNRAKTRNCLKEKDYCPVLSNEEALEDFQDELLWITHPWQVILQAMGFGVY